MEGRKEQYIFGNWEHCLSRPTRTESEAIKEKSRKPTQCISGILQILKNWWLIGGGGGRMNGSQKLKGLVQHLFNQQVDFQILSLVPFSRELPLLHPVKRLLYSLENISQRSPSLENSRQNWKWGSKLKTGKLTAMYAKLKLQCSPMVLPLPCTVSFFLVYSLLLVKHTYPLMSFY